MSCRGTSLPLFLQAVEICREVAFVGMMTYASFVNLVAYLSSVTEFNETGLSYFTRWTRGCPVQCQWNWVVEPVSVMELIS